MIATGKRPLAALFVLSLIVGALLRYAMLSHGIWRDEASTFFDAYGGTWRDVNARVALSELNPPGFFQFMHFWLAAFAPTDLTMKAPAAAASLLLVPLCAWLGTRLKNLAFGVAVAWCTALAPMDLYYAQEARPYMFASCFALVALIGLIDIVHRRPGVSKFALLVVGIMGAMAMQYTGGLLAIAVFGAWAVLAAARKEIRANAVPFAVCVGLVSLIAIALVPALRLQMHAGLSWNEHTRFVQYPEIALRDALVMLPLDWLPVHEAMKAILVVLLLGEAIWAHRRYGKISLPGGLGMAVILGIALAMAILEIPISNHGRYMVPFAPFLWVALCAVIIFGFAADRERTKIGIGLISVFLGILWLCDIAYIHHQQGVRKSGAALLPEIPIAVNGHPDLLAERSTLVVTVPDYLAPSTAYYLRNQSLHLHGFARWNAPQYFSPIGYSALWTDPQAVTKAQAEIRTERSQGMRYLALISMPEADSGLPYGKGNTLVKALRNTYPCRAHVMLIGSIESLTIDVLDLTADSAPSSC